MSKTYHENGNEVRNQALLLAKYLIGETPSERVIESYADIISNGPAISQTSDKLLPYALAHPWSISILDSAASLARPQSELRYRLLAMFALLECQPEYSDKFLAVRHSRFYVVYIAFVGLKAIAKAVCGIVLMKALRI